MRTVESFNDLCELEDLGFRLKGDSVVNAVAMVAYCDGITKQEATSKIFSVNCEDFEEFIKPYFNSVFPYFIGAFAVSKKSKVIWTKIKKFLTRK